MEKQENSQEPGLYINPMTDYGFKRIFGDEKVTAAFLNDLLEPQSRIQKVIFLNKEEQAENEDGKGVVYDIRCQLEDGSEIIIEMQNREQMFFRDRIMYYLSRSITPQGHKGRKENSDKLDKEGNPIKEPWDFKLKPVYGVFFLNFTIDGLQPCMLRTVQMRVAETGEVFNDKVRAYTIEMPLIEGKSPQDCNRKIEWWVYNIFNMEHMTTQLQFTDRQPAFARMGELANYANMTFEQQQSYMRSLDTWRTVIAADKFTFTKGFEKGRAEGEISKAVSIARNLLAMGISAEQIVQATGLTPEEIKTL